MLQIKNINKKFNDFSVLNNISLTLNCGEIISIIGPSGAGKTTLLRIINNLEICNTGSIIVDSIPLCIDGVYSKNKSVLKKFRNHIGFVFQNFNLFPHMTILENIISAPINVLGLDKKIAVNNAKNLLNSLELLNKQNSYPNELSGGQKQRVSIARALALNPNYICFDEPTSALDPKLTKEVGNIIKSLCKQGKGVLIVTHDINFAKQISHKIINLEQGSITNEYTYTDFQHILF